MSEQKPMVIDLRSLVAVRSFVDRDFHDLVKKDPAKAVAQIADEYGFNVPADVTFSVSVDDGKQYNLAIPENPAGELPDEALKALSSHRAGGGVVPTLTADCLCPDSLTGGCACFTIAGTPCMTCHTNTVPGLGPGC